MNLRRAGGFTMVELLLAVTLTAVVAASALAALRMFVEFETRAVERLETRVDVERALQLLARDVVEAHALAFGARQLTITRADGSVVAYAFPSTGYELQRVEAANSLLLATDLLTVQLASVAPQYDRRGHLRDGTYSAAAVVQGATAITIGPIGSALNGAPIGARVRIDYVVGGAARSSSCVAASLVLAEANAKP